MLSFVLSAGFASLILLVNNLIIAKRFRRIERQIDAQIELNKTIVEAFRKLMT